MFLILQMNVIFVMDHNGSLRVILVRYINADCGALIRFDFRLQRASWLLGCTNLIKIFRIDFPSGVARSRACEVGAV